MIINSHSQKFKMAILSSVPKMEIMLKTRGFIALKTVACGLAQAAYLHV
jgi:hypothetical protein